MHNSAIWDDQTTETIKVLGRNVYLQNMVMHVFSHKKATCLKREKKLNCVKLIYKSQYFLNLRDLFIYFFVHVFLPTKFQSGIIHALHYIVVNHSLSFELHRGICFRRREYMAMPVTMTTAMAMHVLVATSWSSSTYSTLLGSINYKVQCIQFKRMYMHILMIYWHLGRK